jgi:hypothetical protein
MSKPCIIDQSLEHIYDLYSPVMYGTAFQFSSKGDEAEKILLATFKKMRGLKWVREENAGLAVKLIKLTVEMACELYPDFKKDNLEFRHYRKSPILFRLICEHKGMESLCSEYHVTSMQLMKCLRKELSLLSDVKRKYLVRTITMLPKS